MATLLSSCSCTYVCLNTCYMCACGCKACANTVNVATSADSYFRSLAELAYIWENADKDAQDLPKNHYGHEMTRMYDILPGTVSRLRDWRASCNINRVVCPW